MFYNCKFAKLGKATASTPPYLKPLLAKLIVTPVINHGLWGLKSAWTDISTTLSIDHYLVKRKHNYAKTPPFSFSHPCIPKCLVMPGTNVSKITQCQNNLVIFIRRKDTFVVYLGYGEPVSNKSPNQPSNLLIWQ